MDDVDGSPVAPFPDWLAELGRRGVEEAYGSAGTFSPDAALINFYDERAKMGMHQDKDERIAQLDRAGAPARSGWRRNGPARCAAPASRPAWRQTRWACTPARRRPTG